MCTVLTSPLAAREESGSHQTLSTCPDKEVPLITEEAVLSSTEP